jgi:hypothetical protein
MSQTTAQLVSEINGGPIAGTRNRIINGDMRIDQRNAGAAITPLASVEAYSVDRWKGNQTLSSKYTLQQNAGSITPPSGFTSYLGATSLSGYSVLTGDTFLLTQEIEGFNSASFGFGTATAATITLSFWVRSSLTGLFGGGISNGAQNRSYVFSYTINAANTWEYKTVTISGDTSGTWLSDNGSGIKVRFGLGSGSTFSTTAGSWQAGDFVQPSSTTSVVGTNGATFYITGVQLEPGTIATPFERRSYGQELALCQRYFQKTFGLAGDYLNYGVGVMGSSTVGFRVCIPIIVPMRTGPTLDLLSTSLFDGINVAAVTATGTVRSTPTSYSIDLNVSGGGLTAFRPAQLLINVGATNYVSLSAEL